MGNINKAVSLTNIFIALPPVRHLLLGIFVLGFVFGISLDIGKQADPVALVVTGFSDGLFLLSIPAVISAVLIKIFIKQVPFRRILATTLAGETLYAMTYLGAYFFSSTEPGLQHPLLFIGTALAFILWYAVARLVFIVRFRALLFASIQLIVHLVFLLSSRIFITGNLEDALLKFSLSSLLLWGVLHLFFIIINAPMKRNFGITSVDAIGFLVGQWLYKTNTMENAFQKVGQQAKTLFSNLAFKRKNDTVFFVTPYVHYGPFGTLGGSEFSAHISERIESSKGQKAFVFHGTVTHDLNPVSSSEISKVMEAFDSSVKSMKFSSSTVSLRTGAYEECRAESLGFKNHSFISLTRAPHTTEDVHFGLGLSIMSEAEKYVKECTLVDQHNAETGDITSFEVNDPVGFSYRSAVIDALLQKEKEKSLSVGISFRPVSLPTFGNAGIKVAIFSSDPEYILILLDSNGIEPEFNSKIQSEIRALGKSHSRDWQVSVFTTDTHQNNGVRGVLNPVREDPVLLEEVKKAVMEAYHDMQPAQFAASKTWFDISVIGPKQSIELISTVNSVVAVSKILGPLLLLAGIAAVVFLVSRVL